MSGWSDAVRLSVGTLTAVPVPPPGVVDRRAGGRAMLLAPAVGLGLGATLAVAAWAGARAGLAPLPVAVAVLGLSALLTRGLHLDGLADTADGLSASYDRARALDVMRRGDVGPSGVATVVIVLLLQAALLAQTLSGNGNGRAPLLVVLAWTASRLGLTVACLRGIPAARPDGLGATVAGAVGRVAAGVVVLAVALAAAGLAQLAGLPVAQGVAAALAGPAAAGLLVLRARRRLGGVTGDVLGACAETSLTASLAVLCLG